MTEDQISTLSEAKRLHSQGELDAAEKLYRQVLSQFGPNADAMNMLGVLEATRGDHQAAYEMFREASRADPQNPGYFNNLGVAARRLNRDREALDAFQASLRLDPMQVDPRCNLGNALLAKGDVSGAVTAYLQVLQLDAAHKGARNNLATAYRQLGRISEAADLYRELATETPDDPAALTNYGVALAERGDHSLAVNYYRQAIDLAPNFSDALNNAGVSLLALGRTGEAEAALQRALGIAADMPAVLGNLGTVYRRQGRVTEAAECFRRAMGLSPDDGMKLRLATLLPVVAASTAELEQARAAMEGEITRLLDEKLHIADPVASVGSTQFNLSYHDRCNREINSKISRLYMESCSQLLFVAPHCTEGAPITAAKRRIGFVSAHFRNHAVGWCYHALMRNLSAEGVSVTAFSLGDAEDALWDEIAADVDHAVVLPKNLFEARRDIAAEALDVLIYTDIGMEPLSYFLAFSRLAPVQCVTNGHPDTTGIPTIDYFVSNDLLEPADARTHYSEELVALPDALIYYTRPPAPNPLKSRKDFGLPEGRNLYLCPQSLFKIHPQMDAPLAEILRRDPDGVLVIFEGAEPHWTKLLMRRWRDVMGPPASNITVLPRQNFDDFLNILALADVLLDTWPFGGGNTSYQGLAMGTPIVTLPGSFARGRSTKALYGCMGMSDTVADTVDDYVAIALRLATDPQWRTEVSKKISEGSSVLFEDKRAIEVFADFLKSVQPGGEDPCA